MSVIKTATKATPEFFVSWDKGDSVSFAKANKEIGASLDSIQPIYKSNAAIANRFQNIDTNLSVRDTISTVDMEFFRPNQTAPRHFRDIIAACMGAYEKVPCVKQIIDLMSDFGCAGIKLVHKNESIQRFYDEWFRRVAGPERSERILNCMYMAGNVIVKRADAKLNPTTAADWKKVVADTDLDHEDGATPNKFEVPYRYTIINPLIVEVLGEHVAAFTGKVHYVLKLPSTFYNTLSLPLTTFDPNILTEGMPRDIQQAMSNNDKYLLLDSDKLVCIFYKKQDWDVWAYPMLFSLLDEIIMLQRLKMADSAALDGIISQVRVWKLGSLEHGIYPTDKAIQKLANILLNNVGGGVLDFCWGPDLELVQTDSKAYASLGPEKYQFVMETIHGGLGIPSAMSKATGGTMTDNFMSLRILLERLQYGRRVLTRFWDAEIRRVQEAMGFRYPAQVVYDNINLHDEVAEKALWLQLLDRHVVSVASVQERFGKIPEIENILINREEASRGAGETPPKVSPYHDAQPDHSLKKIALQRGMIGPEQSGLKVPEPSKGDKKIINSNNPPTPKKPAGAPPKKKKKGVSGQGRPKSSKDKTKRTRRHPKPSSKAETFSDMVLKANRMQKSIADIINPAYLLKVNKANLRKLSDQEAIYLEELKFAALANIEYDQEITEDIAENMDDHVNTEAYENISSIYKRLVENSSSSKGAALTYEELNMARNYAYVLANSEVDDDSD